MVCFGLMQLFYDGDKEFFDSIEVIMAKADLVKQYGGGLNSMAFIMVQSIIA